MLLKHAVQLTSQSDFLSYEGVFLYYLNWLFVVVFVKVCLLVMVFQLFAQHKEV